MRRQILQRWSVILLLGARLFVGELAQAMPHEHAQDRQSLSAIGVAAVAEQPPCHDEKTGHDDSHASHEAPASGGSHDSDCCKSSSGCQCVCVHVFAVAMPALSAVADTAGEHPGAPDLEPAEHRLSGQFRPPA